MKDVSSSSSNREAANVRDRYARRDAGRDANRYSLSDPYALAALGLNAELNAVEIETIGCDPTRDAPPGVDLVLVGDLGVVQIRRDFERHRDVASVCVGQLELARFEGAQQLVEGVFLL